MARCRMTEHLENLLVEALGEFGIAGTSEEARQFRRYLQLLEKWNARVNLTASLEWRSLEALFCEAIWAAGHMPKEPGVHLDIGSGAGFPAIPIRILRPGLRLCLVESRLKRVTFLEAVTRELNLSGTRIVQKRLADFLVGEPEGGNWISVSWKALKLSRPEAEELLKQSSKETLFYLFHGKTLALEDPIVWEKKTELLERHGCPFREGWFLSIYSGRSS